jgi:hypothetical protein
MLSLSQIATITRARGNAWSSMPSRAMKSAQGRPSRYTYAPVLTSTAPSTVTLRFVPGGEAPPRAQAAQRPAGRHMRQQVQAGLVLGQRHRAAGQPASRVTMPVTTWS